MAEFDLTGEVSSALVVPPGESVTVVLTGDFVGQVALEQQKGAGWHTLRTDVEAATYSWRNDRPKPVTLRLRALRFVPVQTITVDATPDGGDLNLDYDGSAVSIGSDEGAAELQAALRAVSGLEDVRVTGSFAAGFRIEFHGLATAEVLTDDSSDLVDGETPIAVTVAEVEIDYTFAGTSLDVVTVLQRDSRGRENVTVRDDSTLAARVGVSTPVLTLAGQAVSNAGNLGSSEDVTTNGDEATPVSLDVYHTRVTTGGSEGDEDLAVGDGTGAIVGQRKLITLVTQGHASDGVALDHANLLSAGGNALDAATLDAEGGFVLLEWTGAAWQVLYSGDATITESA